ncbi:hypothetical protein OROMI_030805 [Orobanche minor]
MAEKQEQAKPKEREIPVFTVLKNNCILKNIFLLDNPPSISSSPSSFQLQENIDQESEIEVILVVGRHPDCNIKLEHPSISRFHLRIHTKPSFRSLYVTDLSSVHGTWISEKKIESGVRMKLNEGDTLRLGASSRLYRLDWVPISRAYDIDNPFVPQLDDADIVDDEETDEAIDQDMNIMSCRNNQVESLSDNLEGIERLFSDEDFSSSKRSTTLVAPLMPLDLYDSVTVDVESLSDNLEGIERLFSDEDFSSSKQSTTLVAPLMPLDLYDSVTVDVESLSDNLEGIKRLFSDEDYSSSKQSTTLVAPLMPLDLYDSITVESRSDNLEGIERLFSDEVFSSSKQSTTLVAPLMPLDLYDSITVESLSDNLEGIERLFSDEDFSSSKQSTTLVAPLMPLDLYDSITVESVSDNLEGIERLFSDEVFSSSKQSTTLVGPLMPLDLYDSITVESLSDNLEGIERLFSDEDFSSSKQSTTLVAPLMPLDLYDSITVESVSDNLEGIERLFSDEDFSSSKQSTTLVAPLMPLALYDSITVESLSDNLEGIERLFSDEDFSSSKQSTTLVAPLMPLDLYDSITVESLSDNLEGIEPLFSDEDFSSSKQSTTLVAPLMPLDLYDSITVESLSDNLDGIERLFSDEDFSSSKQSTTLVAPLMPLDLYDSVTVEEIEKNSSPGLYSEENEGRFEKENSTLVHLETTGTSEMNSDKESCLSIWSRRGKPKSVNVKTSRLRQNRTRVNMSSSVEKSVLDENRKSELVPMDIDDEGESSTPEKANTSPDSPTFKYPGSKNEENLKNGPILNTPISNMDQDDEIFTPDKENMNGPILNTPISNMDQDDEIFTPDKENMTPHSRLLMSMKNILVKNPASSHWKSSPLKTACNVNVYQEGTVVCASEASRRKKVFRESNSINSRKPAAFKCRAENRDPFCPLPLNSPSDLKTDSKPPVSERSTIGSGRCVKYPESREVNCSNNNTIQVAENRWIIVVDTASLLNKKSRNELQLLRGLHGTTLVIPRIVVRELDCMSRRGSLFTRTTEVSAALHYIEESMDVAKWWIRVQSSAEEGKLIPPTPPASSTHCLGEDVWRSSIGSTPFSPCSMQEIATPTAGDHILEYALYYKRIRKDGQLVLLTDDVTLKIKAMAEGVLCETAQEFRRSLVNPFSSRFLYSNCSPIGPTWSCTDDVVLKEKYYPSPSKKMSRSGEGTKGLKLILMHNSSLRQIRHVS